MKHIILASSILLCCGCAYRIVPKERDALAAKQFANIYEAARAQEEGVPVNLTADAIKRAARAGAKVLGFHIEEAENE